MLVVAFFCSHCLGLSDLFCVTCGREARRALQASQLEKEEAEQAAHQYKANPVPANLNHPNLPALPEPSFTVVFRVLPTLDFPEPHG